MTRAADEAAALARPDIAKAAAELKRLQSRINRAKAGLEPMNARRRELVATLMGAGLRKVTVSGYMGFSPAMVNEILKERAPSA